MNDPAIRALLLPQLGDYRAHIEELPLSSTVGAMTRADSPGRPYIRSCIKLSPCSV